MALSQRLKYEKYQRNSSGSEAGLAITPGDGGIQFSGQLSDVDAHVLYDECL